jgi:tellurite resistance protein
MKTDIKNLAVFLATSIWADGEYNEAEKITLGEIADALELDKEKLVAETDIALAEIEKMDEDKVNDYLIEIGAEIDEDEAVMVYMAAMQIVTTDGVLSVEEVDNLLSIATALGIDESYAMLLLIDLVKEEPELEVLF